MKKKSEKISYERILNALYEDFLSKYLSWSKTIPATPKNTIGAILSDNRLIHKYDSGRTQKWAEYTIARDAYEDACRNPPKTQ